MSSTKTYFNLVVSTSDNDINLSDEKRYLKKGLTVAQLKERLELITGRNPSRMEIKVLSAEKELVCILDSDEKTLEDYPISDGMRLVVHDPEYVSFVGDGDIESRFKLTDEEYDKRPGTIREYFKKHKLAMYDPKYRRNESAEEKAKRRELEAIDEYAAYVRAEVGKRCSVQLANEPPRLGTIKFRGKLDSFEGWFVGIKYDEPCSRMREDAAVCSGLYFECPQAYADLVQAKYVQVGDFPEVEEDGLNVDEF